MKLKKILKYSFIILSIAVLVYGAMFISIETNAQSSVAGKNNTVSFMDKLKASKKSQQEEAIKNLYKQYISYKKDNNYDSMYEALKELINLQLDSKIYETKISETESVDIFQNAVELIDLKLRIPEPTDISKLKAIINIEGHDDLKKKYHSELLIIQSFIDILEDNYIREEKILKGIINSNSNKYKDSAYFLLINSYALQKKEDEGINWANKAESYLKNANNIKSRDEKLCRLYLLVGTMYHKKGEIKKDVEYSNKAYNLYKNANLNSPIISMNCLYGKGIALSYEKDYEKSNEYIEKAIVIRDQLFKKKDRFTTMDKVLKIQKKLLEESENGR